MVEALEKKLNSKGSGVFLLGDFSCGQMLQGSDPRSQSFFFAAPPHFFIKVRKFALFSAGIFSFDTLLIACGQLL